MDKPIKYIIPHKEFPDGVYDAKKMEVWLEKREKELVKASHKACDTMKSLTDAEWRQKIEKLNQVICRNCKKPMKQYPYGILAFGCKDCKLKAIIRFEDMPIVKALSEDK